MARTKQTARKQATAGGKAPRKQIFEIGRAHV